MIPFFFSRLSIESFESLSRGFEVRLLFQRLPVGVSRLLALSSGFVRFSEIEMMRRLKAAFDPSGILNPGKVF